jgi:hypothetical protein
MTKVRADGADDPRSKRHHTMDVVKPEGFEPPEPKIGSSIEKRNGG